MTPSLDQEVITKRMEHKVIKNASKITQITFYFIRGDNSTLDHFTMKYLYKYRAKQGLRLN